jgi:hypothetical protein
MRRSDEEARMGEMDIERPVDDAVEQEQDVIPDAGDLDETDLPYELPLEADEADAAEQERELSLDEDDYR